MDRTRAALVCGWGGIVTHPLEYHASASALLGAQCSVFQGEMERRQQLALAAPAPPPLLRFAFGAPQWERGAGTHDGGAEGVGGVGAPVGVA
jgi:hypothetical protein